MLHLPRILIIEDDEDDFILVRDVIEEYLGELKCQISHRLSGEGLEAFLKDQVIDIAIVDYRLGKDNGIELGKHIRTIDPSVSIIILSGVSSEDLNDLDSLASGIGAADFLSKRDLNPRMLAKSIRYALERTRQMRAIKDRDLQLEEVLQSSSLALWWENIDTDGRLFYSESVEGLTGYKKEVFESGDMRWLAGVHQDDLKMVSGLRQQALDKGESQATYRFKTMKGDLIWISERVTCTEHPVRRSGRRLNGRLQNVTEEYLKRTSLERSEQFLKEMGSMAHIGGWRYTKGADKVLWSDQTYRIHGIELEDEVSLEKALEFFPHKARDKVEQSFRDCINNGIPYDVVVRLRTENGLLRWARIKGEPIFRKTEIIGAWGVIQDITDVHNMELEQGIFYDMAVEMSCIVSPEGYFIQLNKRWEDVLGWKPGELMQTHYLEFVHPEDREKTTAAYETVHETGVINDFENRFRHRNGEWLTILWHAQLGPDEETIYSLARDITGRRAEETELKDALYKAEVANMAKNQFLMVMSHELRTPLNPIMGCVDLLMENEKDPKARVMLQLIKDSATHLTSLIGDVLDISSIEAGRITLEKESFSVSETIQSCADLLRANAESQALRLEVLHDGSADGETPLVCIGDKRKFRQIILNLIGNAIKFTHKGSISVDYSYRIDGDSGMAHVTIQVMDTGIGIPENQKEHIFERFYQVSMSRSRSYQGQGLGLSLCSEFARAMGGDITVQSIPGEGSTFTVTLPLELAEKESIHEETIVTERSDEKPSTEGSLVLIAEDDPVNQLVLQRLLKRLEARFVCVKDGQEGVEVAEGQAFDVILMDIQMPVLDGIEATRKIRNGSGPNQKTPIIAVTAHSLPLVREACFEAGMTEFIEKPVSLKDLKEKLLRLPGVPA